MALECTHIRFALALKDRFKAKDMKKYISGTVYPDSRYITKIARNLTHNKEFADKKFYNNDNFKKGWAVHLICDEILPIVRQKSFPDLLGKNKGEIHQGNELWIIVTALKIILDIKDFEKFDLQKYIDFLKYVETPNGEDIVKMKEFNQIFIDMYKGKDKIFIDDAIQMWLKLGINKELATKIKNKTEELIKDENIVKRIETIYDKMIEYYEHLSILSNGSTKNEEKILKTF